MISSQIKCRDPITGEIGSHHFIEHGINTVFILHGTTHIGCLGNSRRALVVFHIIFHDGFCSVFNVLDVDREGVDGVEFINLEVIGTFSG